MKIKLTTVYVNDQERALRFYTEALGLKKKADFTNGDYRWLTVVSPEDPEGTELQLASNVSPAAKAFQEAQLQQNQPALMLFTDDVAADHQRIAARGGEFVMPPTDVKHSIIAQLSDGCGNLVQLAQLKRWS
jgi:predicted enzyme related to lactoylglutathione lyase